MANPPQHEEENFVIDDGSESGQFQENFEEEDVDHHQEEEHFEPFENPHDENQIDNNEVEVDNSVSAVASAPAKNILILVIMVIISGVFLYKYVFKDSAEVTAAKKKQQQIAEQPAEQAVRPTKQDDKPQGNIGVVDTPELPVMENVQPPPPLVSPEAPKVEAKIEVPAPIQPIVTVAPDPVKEPQIKKVEEPVTEITGEPPLETADNTPTGPSPEEKMSKRRKSGMMIINGGGSPALADKVDANGPGKSSVTPIKATKVEDLGLMILQGKMLDAILETTINTDLPGSLRAIISRDIYAEQGKTILIPRGSRLIGTYANNIQAGQQRVLVTWGRVIRPDGVDIDIASSGTDQLGRAGMTGIVDNKYFEIFSNSFLVSAVTIGGAIALNSVQKSQAVTTSSTSAADGSTTSSQTSSPTDAAVLQAVQNLGDTAKKLAQSSATQPTIIVNQGSRIKVFVNKDLIFPASVVNRVSSGN